VLGHDAQAGGVSAACPPDGDTLNEEKTFFNFLPPQCGQAKDKS